jgi:putative FmdB family regulatory protein
MPLLEFACRECGTIVKKLVRKSGADAEVVCPACGSRDVEEKVSAFSSPAKRNSSGGCATTGV